MKQGIDLSRLVDDPASKKRFLIALVVVVALHLILLTVWKISSPAQVVNKKNELTIELGMPPPSGAMGIETPQPPLTHESPGQTDKPTNTPQTTLSKTPGSKDTASKPGSPVDQAKITSESPAVLFLPSAPAVSQSSSQSPSQTPSQALNSTVTPTRPVENLLKPGESPAAPANPVVLPQATGVKDTNDAFRTAEADYKAAYLNNPRPAYPRLAHRMGIEGTVILLADVSEEGATLQVRLFQSSGNDLLDQSALSTVSQWRFTPARKDGVITRSTVRIPITFSLKVQARK